MDLINDLKSAKIITDNEGARISNFLNKQTTQHPLSPLNTLYYFFLNRDSEEINTNVGIVVVAEESAPLSSDEQNSKEVIAFLEILLKYELIDGDINRKLHEVLKHSILNEFYILHLANELLKLQETFTTENQLEFAQTLNQSFSNHLIAGMLDHEEQQRLQADITENKVQSYFDFFKYSRFCKILDLLQYPDGHEKLLADLTEIINTLTYTIFKIEEITFSTSDFSGIPVHHPKKWTININTGEEIHQFEYSVIFISEIPELKRGYDQTLVKNILQSVNSLLADFNCSYRFTSLISKLPGLLFPEHNHKLIICRVDRENYQIFDFCNLEKRFLYNDPSLNFQLPLSYKHIAYTIHHFKESGIFSNLSEAEVTKHFADVYKKKHHIPAEILTDFPELVIPVITDPLPGKKPYKEFLENLNRISKGILNFSNIEDEFPNYELEAYYSPGEFKVSFEIDEERHEFICNYLEMGFNNPVIYKVIEIISQNYPDYQLIRVPTSRIYHNLYLFTQKESVSYLESIRLL
ncbi:hypothetical protein [Pedobacter sp. V48]|uniref:hypothetical protein n=1 Tax=Pedobacter sp. V48 TaxID=509635 RepID=UPI0003E49920|nr:hypothetical protein [Pedobacter sp. V48]ETZ20085.1 hypothetical protein N824_07680 [Pedobacter sp. V48]